MKRYFMTSTLFILMAGSPVHGASSHGESAHFSPPEKGLPAGVPSMEITLEGADQSRKLADTGEPIETLPDVGLYNETYFDPEMTPFPAARENAPASIPSMPPAASGAAAEAGSEQGPGTGARSSSDALGIAASGTAGADAVFTGARPEAAVSEPPIDFKETFGSIESRWKALGEGESFTVEIPGVFDVNLEPDYGRYADYKAPKKWSKEWWDEKWNGRYHFTGYDLLDGYYIAINGVRFGKDFPAGYSRWNLEGLANTVAARMQSGHGPVTLRLRITKDRQLATYKGPTLAGVSVVDPPQRASLPVIKSAWSQWKSLSDGNKFIVAIPDVFDVSVVPYIGVNETIDGYEIYVNGAWIGFSRWDRAETADIVAALVRVGRGPVPLELEIEKDPHQAPFHGPTVRWMLVDAPAIAAAKEAIQASKSRWKSSPDGQTWTVEIPDVYDLTTVPWLVINDSVVTYDVFVDGIPVATSRHQGFKALAHAVSAKVKSRNGPVTLKMELIKDRDQRSAIVQKIEIANDRP